MVDIFMIRPNAWDFFVLAEHSRFSRGALWQLLSSANVHANRGVFLFT